MSYQLTDNTGRIIIATQRQAMFAVRSALEDVKRISRPKTPYSGGGKHGAGSGGHLRDSTLISIAGLKGYIAWNKAYALPQEEGYVGKKHSPVRNYTTQGTGAHFAEKAVRTVASDPMKYFRKSVSIT